MIIVLYLRTNQKKQYFKFYDIRKTVNYLFENKINEKNLFFLKKLKFET